MKFKRLFTAFLVLSLLVGVAPSAMVYADYDSSGVFSKSDLVNASGTDTSVTVDFSPYIESVKDIYTFGETKIEISTLATDINWVYTLPVNDYDFTLNGLVSGLMYDIKIKPLEYTSSGEAYEGFVYVMYQTKGEIEYDDIPKPVIDTGTVVAPSQPEETEVPVVTDDPETPVVTDEPDVPVVTDEPEIPVVTDEPVVTPEPDVLTLSAPVISKAYLAGDKLFFIADYSIEARGIDYEVYYKNKSGKYVKWADKCGTTTLSECYSYGLDKYTTYYVRARAYGYDEGSNKVYSEWSSKKYFIHEPIIDTKRSRRNMNASYVKLNWTKVKGAKKYIVYCSNSNKGKYTKVATTKKTSAKITKYKGKKLNLLNKKKYFYVIAVTNAGGKTIKSLPYTRIYCQYYKIWS